MRDMSKKTVSLRPIPINKLERLATLEDSQDHQEKLS